MQNLSGIASYKKVLHEIAPMVGFKTQEADWQAFSHENDAVLQRELIDTC
jgi:hypothetical protein